MTYPILDWEDLVILEDASTASLSTILPQKWGLVVLFRHAECMECNLLVHELNALHNHFSKWNTQVIGIGIGNVSSLRRLRSRLGIHEDVILCAHPTRLLHKKLKLKNSILGAWGFKALWNTIKGFQQGHLQTSIAFPMGQQSGLVLLSPDREIRWIHRSEYLGDIPTRGNILEQLLLHQMEE